MRGKEHGKIVALLMVGLALLMFAGCKNSEHPTDEHPTDERPTEKSKEHPSDSGAQSTVTKDQLADAIEAHVQKTSAEHGGYFEVFDAKTGQALKLTLDKVHRKRLSRVGGDLYFACADFKTTEGKVYDLDVFMQGTSKDNLTFSKFTVHKEAGRERYTWHEKNGVWYHKPLAEEIGKINLELPDQEHPAEHPK